MWKKCELIELCVNFPRADMYIYIYMYFLPWCLRIPLVNICIVFTTTTSTVHCSCDPWKGFRHQPLVISTLKGEKLYRHWLQLQLVSTYLTYPLVDRACKNRVLACYLWLLCFLNMGLKFCSMGFSAQVLCVLLLAPDDEDDAYH